MTNARPTFLPWPRSVLNYVFTLNDLVVFIKHRGEENSVASELTNQLGGLSQHIVKGVHII